MQGSLTIKEEWTDINTLPFKDINGSSLTLIATSGDTLKFYDIANVLLWQGSTPTSDTEEGTIILGGNVIMGVGNNTVWLKAKYSEKQVTVELVKGA